jgi:hypothetical protein
MALLPLLGTPALALPAPMSDPELMDKSDLVVVVSVLSCTAVTKDEKTGEELPAYLAKLRLTDVKKGDAKVGDVVIPKDIVGPWTVNCYPGELVLTHLAKRSGGVSYGSTWWNAKRDDMKAPESTDLPTVPGETHAAARQRPSQSPSLVMI